MESGRNIHIPVVSNLWICKGFHIFPWPLLFMLNSDIKNPQTGQTIIIYIFFFIIDSCNRGLVINWMSLPHITIWMLESSSFTGLPKEGNSGHCATSCFFLHLSLGKIKISQYLLQLYSTVLVKMFFQKLLCFLILLALIYVSAAQVGCCDCLLNSLSEQMISWFLFLGLLTIFLTLPWTQIFGQLSWALMAHDTT